MRHQENGGHGPGGLRLHSVCIRPNRVWQDIHNNRTTSRGKTSFELDLSSHHSSFTVDYSLFIYFKILLKILETRAVFIYHSSFHHTDFFYFTFTLLKILEEWACIGAQYYLLSKSQSKEKCLHTWTYQYHNVLWYDLSVIKIKNKIVKTSTILGKE